ncbi:hypothetical protein, partial [Pseudomonas syringae group genomosp. 3]|uniref:hypothetical protein n=1 Tax=Pseudomonas syringae group genomosp. 3 TaxID=251701 RepID=UPI001C6132EA
MRAALCVRRCRPGRMRVRVTTLCLALRTILVASGLAAFWNAQGDRHQLDERYALRFWHGVQLG